MPIKLLQVSELASDFKQIYSNQYFGNTVWLLAENGMRLVAGLFVGVWVVRYLGSEDFGVLSYANSFVVVFAALGSLGVALDMKTEQGKLEGLIKHVFYLLLAISVGMLISSQYLVSLLYGREFLANHFVVSILVFAIPLTYLGTITNKLLLKFGLGKVIFIKQFHSLC